MQRPREALVPLTRSLDTQDPFSPSSLDPMGKADMHTQAPKHLTHLWLAHILNCPPGGNGQWLRAWNLKAVESGLSSFVLLDKSLSL